MASIILWLALAVALLVIVSLLVNRIRKPTTDRRQFAFDAQQPVSNDALTPFPVPVQQRAAIDHFPYLKKKYLLSRAERSFYEVLSQAAGNEMILFTKVRLCDLVYLPPATSDRQTHMNRVIQKHVDFLLCSRENVSPIMAVELDDSSHGRDDRKERDLFLDELFRRIGLPLLRVPVKMSYDPNQLAGLIRKSVLSTATPPH